MAVFFWNHFLHDRFFLLEESRLQDSLPVANFPEQHRAFLLAGFWQLSPALFFIFRQIYPFLSAFLKKFSIYFA
jgi:hypothetical protein